MSNKLIQYISSQLKMRIYQVKATDTWESIAEQFYGSPNALWKIQVTNKHLLPNPEKLAEGQMILIP